jgi:hypothetical protein
MPTDSDDVDAEERRNRRHGQTLEFVHYDDSPTSRWQVVECPPHRGSDQKLPFRIIMLGCRLPQLKLMALTDRFLAPLISSDVDKHADQPRLFIRQSVRNGTP